MVKKTKTIKINVYRSAKTGYFVSKNYAQKHKSTTVKETVKKGIR